MQTPYVPYLTNNDYLPSINSGQLNNQILDAIERGGDQQRMFAESWAIGQVHSYIGDYFDLEFEITPTNPYSNTKKYYAGDRIVIDFPEWIASSGSQDESDTSNTTYNKGQCVIKYSDQTNLLGGVGYMRKETGNETQWDENSWTRIGNQYDVYYIKYPHPVFILNIEESRGIKTRGYYYVGDKVCYNKRIYQCMIETSKMSHSSYIQFYRTYDVPPPNIFPDLPNNQQWKDLGEYYFVGEPPFYPSENGLMYIGIGGTESTRGAAEGDDSEGQDAPTFDVVQQIENNVWELGDNRDPVLIQCLVNLSIWMLCNRISSDNIPVLRQDNKNASFQYLRDVKAGTQGTRIPRIQPIQGGDVSWGSNTKKRNGYG